MQNTFCLTDGKVILYLLTQAPLKYYKCNILTSLLFSYFSKCYKWFWSVPCMFKENRACRKIWQPLKGSKQQWKRVKMFEFTCLGLGVRSSRCGDYIFAWSTFWIGQPQKNRMTCMSATLTLVYPLFIVSQCGRRLHPVAGFLSFLSHITSDLYSILLFILA